MMLNCFFLNSSNRMGIFFFTWLIADRYTDMQKQGHADNWQNDLKTSQNKRFFK